MTAFRSAILREAYYSTNLIDENLYTEPTGDEKPQMKAFRGAILREAYSPTNLIVEEPEQ